MKYTLLFGLIIFLGNCKTLQPIEYDYYWYSTSAYKHTSDLIEWGAKPSPNHTTIDGVEYTCLCSPEYVEQVYKVYFPDVKLVKKVPKNTGKIDRHF